jgi:lipoprotein NlpI
MVCAVVEWLPTEPAVSVRRRAGGQADVRVRPKHAAGGQREDALALRLVPAVAPERKEQATRADMATLRGLCQSSVGIVAGAESDLAMTLAIEPDHQAAQVLAPRRRARR